MHPPRVLPSSIRDKSFIAGDRAFAEACIRTLALQPQPAKDRQKRVESLLGVFYAAESDGGRAINAGTHQQVFPVLAQLISLRKVPSRALRLIVAAAAQNCVPRVFVDNLLGPLPNVAHQILNSKDARTRGMSSYITGRRDFAAFVWRGHRARIPGISPRELVSIETLRRVLPLPFVRQPLP